jgi:hypothetical protein
VENEAPEGQQEAQQQEGQEGAAPPQQEQEEVQKPHYDYDPELVRTQYEEVRRREREAERRERELEKRARELSERSRFNEPSLESMDPSVAFLARMIQEDREERRSEKEDRQKQEQEQQDMERLGQEAYFAFVSSASNRGMTRDQAAREWGAFSDLLLQHYPDHNMLSAIGPDRAVQNVLPLFKRGNNLYPQSATTTTRVTPRTPVVTAQGTGPVEDRSDLGPQRQGESNTEYAQRVLRNYEALGLKGLGLRDGDKISSE